MNFNENSRSLPYSANRPYVIAPSEEEVMYNVNEVARLAQIQANEVVRLTKENHKLKEQHRRRKVLDQQLTVDTNGFYLVVKTYDTGEKDAECFFIGPLGQMFVYNVIFVGKAMADEFFAIRFAKLPIFVIGMKRRAGKGEYLRECFANAGIMFGQIGDKLICQILRQWLAPLITNCVQDISIPNLTGWYNGMYLNRQNYYCKSPELLSLPVLKKEFVADMDKVMPAELYITVIKKIHHPSDRLVLMLYPLAGILSSIITGEGCRRNFYLNIVWQADRVNIENVCSYLQVMNRNYLLPYVVQKLDRANCDYMCKFKDEVMIVDGRQVSDDNSDYSQKVLTGNTTKIRRILTGKEGVSGTNRPIEAALVTITSCMAYGDDVLNLFVDDDFFCGDKHCDSDGRAIGLFFIYFIHYAEKNMDDIRAVIKQDVSKVNSIADYFSLLFKIYSQFWQNEGIDIARETGVADLNFEEVFDASDYCHDDILDIFCKAVRTGVRNRVMLATRERKYADDAIYFDDNFVFIPSQVWQALLREERLWRYHNLIKNKLKEKRLLSTDGEGLTRKLQVDGRRFECYVILKSFFDKAGNIALENLGRRKCDD